MIFFEEKNEGTIGEKFVYVSDESDTDFANNSFHNWEETTFEFLHI